MKKLLTIALLYCANTLNAQEAPNSKFGKISPEDLQKKVYAIDSSADAVVLFDIGSSEIVGNSKGWFSFEYTRHKRIHILNKNGYAYADAEIPLYNEGNDQEKIQNIKAVTYNLENGKVTETKLDKSGIFNEQIDKKHSRSKFTFPNVKEGSIVEYEYKVLSDFYFNLEPWDFQGSAPRLWSEYKTAIPQFFNYITLSQGYRPFFIKDHKEKPAIFNVKDERTTEQSETTSISCTEYDTRWVMKDVPALKEENYTSTLENHLSRVEFQLSAYTYPLVDKKIMGSWPDATKELMESDDFGNELTNNNAWLSDAIKEAVGSAATDMEKARKIYGYVRDNFSCTNYMAIRTQQTLKNVFKTRKGSVAEVNLLLTAMLKRSNIIADPVLLSTRSHPFAYEVYPIMARFNYVVCQANIDGKNYYLDASHDRLGFGKLPYECYNGSARVVNEAATSLYFISDSLKEQTNTSVIIANDDKGKWIGSLNNTFGYYASCSLRDELKEKGEDSYYKNLKKEYSEGFELEKPTFDSLSRYEDPVTMHYSFDISKAHDDIIYFSPMMTEGYKQNPFKSAERFYPVEMPYVPDQTYTLTMEVPDGYEVDELPKSVRVKLNEDNDGMFEYLVARSGNIISLRSKLKLNRAIFQPDEYNYLREFFNLVVSKHNEQIVFKKKK